MIPMAQIIAEGNTVSLQIMAQDPNGYSLDYAANGLPPGLSINSHTGLISGTIDYTAAEFFQGHYNVGLTVGNGHGGSASQTFTWTVTDTNLPPGLTNPGTQTSAQGNAVSLPLQASDPDNDPLTFDATGLPAGLTIDGSTGVISGTVGLTAAQSSPY